jgi:hypothetical protein
MLRGDDILLVRGNYNEPIISVQIRLVEQANPLHICRAAAISRPPWRVKFQSIQLQPGVSAFKAHILCEAKGCSHGHNLLPREPHTKRSHGSHTTIKIVQPNFILSITGGRHLAASAERALRRQ